MINYTQAGFQIRNRRKELGLTQEIVAEKVDITPSYYSQIESGVRKAGINTFVNISQVLSLSLDSILCNHINISSFENFDIIDKKIFYHLNDLNQLEKEYILDVIIAFDKLRKTDK